MPDQIVIQVLLLVAVAVVAILLTRSTANARHQAIRRILLVGFVALAALSVIFPDWLTWLARRVGVGRGADLLLYALVIAFLSYIATSFRRLGELDRKLTLLTRELALTRARLEEADGASPSPDAPASGSSGSVSPAPGSSGGGGGPGFRRSGAVGDPGSTGPAPADPGSDV